MVTTYRVIITLDVQADSPNAARNIADNIVYAGKQAKQVEYPHVVLSSGLAET